MNWKLILALSLFGLAMAVASLFGLGLFELLLWLIIFVIYAWIIAKHSPGKYFLQGFLVSVVNSIWITAIHVVFFSMYIRTNPQMVQGTPPGMNPRIIMIVAGPIVGVVLGLIAGLFTLMICGIYTADLLKANGRTVEAHFYSGQRFSKREDQIDALDGPLHGWRNT